MGVFDQAARYGAKLDPPGFLRWLLPELDPALSYGGWLDARTLPFPGEPDRVCDTVAGFHHSSDPDHPLALVVEFQAELDLDILDRFLEYLARLRRELRHGPDRRGKYQVAAALLNLTGPIQEKTLEMLVPGLKGIGVRLGVEVRILREEDAAGTLVAIANSKVARCILTWIPLMHGGAEAGIIEQWKELASAEPDNRRRADYGGLALVFAELAGNHQEWKQGLKGWNMRQSQQVLEWQEEAKVEVGRTFLLKTLQARFPNEITPDLKSTIETTADWNQLARWFELALSVRSLEEFRDAARPSRNGS